ncbi:Regulator of Vps4 activity in the MVB pathway protein [Abeliophyllum distichum]|uniref:Regulator of Vps4 activity in the MVB pathway protein n=1 Tax=Abeliophyllum distichum TaxID=126358 RepID=A0ABD1QU49_9LAMI
MVDNIVAGHIRHNNGVHKRKGETIEALSCETPDESTSCTGFLGKSEDLISPPDHVSRKNMLNLTEKARLEETDRLKSCFNNLPPPPYVKSKDNAILPLPPYTKPKEDKHRADRGSKYGRSDFDGHFMDSSPHNRSKSVNSLGKSHEKQDHHDLEGKSLGLVKIDSHGNKKEADYPDDAIPLPKPRSIRKKHQKSSSNHDSVRSVDDFSSVKRSSSSRRRDHSRKGLQILFDNEHHQNDEEERVIDKLLIHYCKKPSSYDAGKLKKKLLAHSSHQRAIQSAIDTGELLLDQSRDGQDFESEMVPQPSRSISLPPAESASPQVKKVFTRANTFQPDNQARHVHPKLPDYDDLAARFAALKGQ